MMCVVCRNKDAGDGRKVCDKCLQEETAIAFASAMDHHQRRAYLRDFNAGKYIHLYLTCVREENKYAVEAQDGTPFRTARAFRDG